MTMRSHLPTATYRQAEEHALVQAARAGDEQALVELLDRHRGYIRQLALRYGRWRSLEDDLEQEGRIGFLSAVYLEYEPSSPVPLWGFARHVVRSHMLKHLWKYWSREFPDPIDDEPEAPEPEPPDAEVAPAAWAEDLEEGGVERVVCRCLGPGDPATKWLVLFVLRTGGTSHHARHLFAIYADLHVRTGWEMIAEDLQDEHAAVGQPAGPGLSVWFCLCRVYRFSPRVPDRWHGVCLLFRRPDPRTGRPAPPVNAPALRQFYRRSLAALAACAGVPLAPEQSD